MTLLRLKYYADLICFLNTLKTNHSLNFIIKKKDPATIAIVPPAESFKITDNANPTSDIKIDEITQVKTNLFIEDILFFKAAAGAAIKDTDTTVPTAGIITETVIIINANTTTCIKPYLPPDAL